MYLVWKVKFILSELQEKIRSRVNILLISVGKPNTIV